MIQSCRKSAAVAAGPRRTSMRDVAVGHAVADRLVVRRAWIVINIMY